MLKTYVYKIVFKFKCIHGCWLKQLMLPSLNTTLLGHDGVHLLGGPTKVKPTYIFVCKI